MQQQSQLASLEAKAKQSAQNAERIRRERDEALREVQHLKKLLKKKEEECLTAEEELMKARRVRALWDWNISSCLTPFSKRTIFKLGQVQTLSKTSFIWMRILSSCHGLHSYPITSWNLNKIPCIPTFVTDVKQDRFSPMRLRDFQTQSNYYANENARTLSN